MKTLALWILLIVVSSASTSGAGIIVFQNDFNHDTVDQNPTSDPPLAPADDTFRYSDGSGSFLVRAAVGDLLDQPLEMVQGSALGSHYIRAGIGIAHQTCQSFVVSWRSLLRAKSTFFISADFRGSSGALYGSISWRGTAIVFNAGGSNEANLPQGWAPDVSQLFEMKLDMTTDTFSLSLDGVAVPEVQNQSFRTPGDALVSFGISFGGRGPQTIVVDDLRITGTSCGQVLLDRPTWSGVKARFGI